MAKQKGRPTRNQKISAANEAALQQLKNQAAGAEQPQVTGEVTVVVSAETNDNKVISSSELFKEGPYMESSVFQTQKPTPVADIDAAGVDNTPQPDQGKNETETVQSPDQQQAQAKPEPASAATAPTAETVEVESVDSVDPKAAKKAAKAAKKAAKEAAEKAEEAIKDAKKAAKRAKSMPSEITGLRLEPIIARAMMFA